MTEAHFALAGFSTAPGEGQGFVVGGLPWSLGEEQDAGEHAEVVGAPDGGAVEGEDNR